MAKAKTSVTETHELPQYQSTAASVTHDVLDFAKSAINNPVFATAVGIAVIEALKYSYRRVKIPTVSFMNPDGSFRSPDNPLFTFVETLPQPLIPWGTAEILEGMLITVEALKGLSSFVPFGNIQIGGS